MDKATRSMLTETEQALLRETDRAALERLDEDGLVALHDRVRRARTKYSKLYRRRASAQVRLDAGRAGAHAKHARTSVKAEAFEDALARVSRHLARAAKATADALKAERLAAARKTTPARTKGSSRGKGKASSGPASTRAHVKRRTPASKRAQASSRATTRRHQAKRDSA